MSPGCEVILFEVQMRWFIMAIQSLTFYPKLLSAVKGSEFFSFFSSQKWENSDLY